MMFGTVVSPRSLQQSLAGVAAMGSSSCVVYLIHVGMARDVEQLGGAAAAAAAAALQGTLLAACSEAMMLWL